MRARKTAVNIVCVHRCMPEVAFRWRTFARQRRSVLLIATLRAAHRITPPNFIVPRAGAKDANADGRTTRSEAKKANVDLSDPRDLNDDGKVTRSEAHAVENARARGQLP